jgi:hypothetical protein
MEVEYEITRDDLYAFQWRAVFHSPMGRRSRRMVYLLWFVALLLAAIVPAIGPDGFTLSRVSFGFLITAFPIVALAQWFVERRLIRGTILGLLKDEKPGKGHLGKHRLVLSEDGVLESTAVGDSRTSWSGVDRVEENREYIFIYTTPTAAHMIPKRAFRSADEAEAFYRFAGQRRAAAAA